VVFARRTITRPDALGDEQHVAVTPERFGRLREQGEFAMNWDANGNCYGIGREIRVWLAQGLTVVVNGSREYAPRALRDFPDMELVHITAPTALLRRRLMERRREARSLIQGRLQRADRFQMPEEMVSAELVNDGDIAHAGRQLLEYLLPVRAPTQEP
jgi:ribose 1,5-bisphosphokinase